MEGYPGKLPSDISSYTYTGASQSCASVAPPPPGPITHTPSFIPHPTSQTEKDLGMTPGTSVQEEGLESSMTGSTGRKKKKKHKSGEDPNAKSTIMSEEEFVDAAIPVLSESQGGAGVEELVVGSTVPPPPDGTVVGGQYLLNNTLLDHILTEKKMQMLQSPDVIEYLKKQMSKK